MSRRPPVSATPRITARDALTAVLIAAVGGLVAVSWLGPTEGAIHGDTVPQAIAWMLLATAWLFLSPPRPALRWERGRG